MTLWSKYKARITYLCTPAHVDTSLPYWRDHIFTKSVTYVLPLGLLALIPGIPLTYLSGFFGMMAVDLITVVGLLCIALLGGISLINRKRIFVFLIYLMAVTLLLYMGSYGPSLVYLLAVSVFTALIFPSRYIYFPPTVNLIIALLYAVYIYFNPQNAIFVETVSPVAGWLGVSVNMVFLSYFFSLLIPPLFEGLQKNIDQKSALQHELEEEQAKLEAMLNQLKFKNYELEQYAYVVSHDLQEPLRMVTSFLELVESKLQKNPDPKTKEYIDVALNGAKRMRILILDLLEYSQLDNLDTSKQIFDVEVVLQELLQELQLKINEENVSIHIEKMPQILGHRTAIRQLFKNLIQNGIKFQLPGHQAQLHIRHQIVGEYHQFSVQDNGIGIDPEYNERIFEVFKRLHSSSEYPGTGIGLAMCKKIVAKHGGVIWLQSKIGVGSTFYFTIPL